MLITVFEWVDCLTIEQSFAAAILFTIIVGGGIIVILEKIQKWCGLEDK